MKNSPGLPAHASAFRGPCRRHCRTILERVCARLPSGNVRRMASEIPRKISRHALLQLCCWLLAVGGIWEFSEGSFPFGAVSRYLSARRIWEYRASRLAVEFYLPRCFVLLNVSFTTFNKNYPFLSKVSEEDLYFDKQS